MTELNLIEQGLRGVTTDNYYIYYTVKTLSDIHVVSHSGEILGKMKAPAKMGALKFKGGNFYAISQTEPKPCIYRLNEKFKVISKIQYLKTIPPKYLPEQPYDRYGTGITASDHGIYVTFLGGKYIAELDTSGKFVRAHDVPIRADGSPIDVAGIDFYQDRMIMADLTKSIVYHAGKPLITLPPYASPFDIDVSYNKLLVSCEGKKDILLFTL